LRQVEVDVAHGGDDYIPAEIVRDWCPAFEVCSPNGRDGLQTSDVWTAGGGDLESNRRLPSVSRLESKREKTESKRPPIGVQAADDGVQRAGTWSQGISRLGPSIRRSSPRGRRWSQIVRRLGSKRPAIEAKRPTVGAKADHDGAQGADDWSPSRRRKEAIPRRLGFVGVSMGA
jgi:hypothetical protein